MLRVKLFEKFCVRNFRQSSINLYEDSPKPEEYNPNKKPVKQHIQEDLQRLKWRTPMSDSEWYSKLKLFAPEEKDSNSNFLTMMQQPIDLSPSNIKQFFVQKEERLEKALQQFIPERHEILGNDLAAAHFIVHRGGAIKFQNHSDWIKKDDDDEYNLPSRFDPNYKLTAIKCDNMRLYYEGLENIRRLAKLKFLSFHNVKPFDDWCLDRVSGSEFPSLEILDLSGTCITENGLNALYRLPTLKLLILDGMKRNKSMELMCASLEDLYPNIKLVEGTEVHT